MNSAAKALRGLRLWVTRPLEQSKEWTEACRRVGASPFVLPCVAITPVADPQQWVAAEHALETADLLVLTSPTVVRLVAAPLAHRARSPFLQVAAVGPGTAEMARAAGLRVTLVPERADASGLAKALQRAMPLAGRRVFLPQGDHASPDLIRRLQQSGAMVTAPVLYYNQAPEDLPQRLREALQERSPDWILVASGSAFSHLLQAWPPENTPWPRLASIGPRTTEILRAAGFPPAAEASVPTIDALLAAMASAEP
ncbi:MAG: uroporphyrinogen-III synthase [Candidatus Sericytochromatia bacterium]|nr:uroporphyrinogen-III synthase [Candidatus Sericytochromatia bacterium]